MMEICSRNTIKKQTKGRQKIEIKKINSKNALQVTFSKRRAGLFQKASELCISCGAQMAIVTFSPGNKAYTFGNPSVDYVIDRFLDLNANEHAKNAASFDANVKRREYFDAVEKLNIEKGSVVLRRNDGFWWDGPIEELDLEELEVFKDSLQELRNNIVCRVNELMMNNSLIMSANQFGGMSQF